MRDTLKQILERTDNASGRAFDLAVQALILLSVASFSIETLPGLSEDVRRVLAFTAISVASLFGAEYLLRLYVVDSATRYARSFYGMVDFVAIAPSILALGVDLRSLGAIRFLRMIRLFKLVRYSEALARCHRALQIVKEELVIFTFLACLTLYFAAVGIYYVERDAQPEAFASVFHSLWRAVATLTTVGYGDVIPQTAGGRLFTFGVLMISLGLVAVPAGLVASGFSQAREELSRKEP